MSPEAAIALTLLAAVAGYALGWRDGRRVMGAVVEEHLDELEAAVRGAAAAYEKKRASAKEKGDEAE